MQHMALVLGSYSCGSGLKSLEPLVQLGLLAVHALGVLWALGKAESGDEVER